MTRKIVVYCDSCGDKIDIGRGEYPCAVIFFERTSTSRKDLGATADLCDACYIDISDHINWGEKK